MRVPTMRPQNYGGTANGAHAGPRTAVWPGDVGGPLRSRARRLGVLAALLALSWLAPLALHALRLDIVQLALLLVAVASILRSGSNVVDRLMLAGALLTGTILGLGLLFSVWPWGLDPVPVGGMLFSTVTLAGWSARRRPSMPRRWLGSDAVVLGAGLFAFWAAYHPIAGLSVARRFIYSAHTTDRFTHFALFDTIHRLGGYAFLHQIPAQISLQNPTQLVYPSGSHFLYAVLDTFLRSTPNPGPSLPEFNRYFIYVLGGYAFLVVAIVWSARWIAGPSVAGWRRFVISSAAAGLALGGTLVQLVEYGLDPDVVALAFLALMVAVTARPPRLAREQVLITVALLVAVAYTYNLYAFEAVLGIGSAAVVYRHRLRRHWRFAVPVTAAAAVIAFYPSALSLTAALNVRALTLATHGYYVRTPVILTVVLGILIAAPVITGLARRRPASQVMTALMLGAGAVAGAFGLYQILALGHTSYYFGKFLLAGYVTSVVGVGALGVFLRRVVVPSSPRRRRLAQEAALAVTGAAIVLSLTGGFPWSWNPAWRDNLSLAWPAQTPLSAWASGQYRSFAGPSLAVLADAHLLGDGVPTLVLNGSKGDEWYDSHLAAALNRDLGVMTPPLSTILADYGDGSPAARLRQVRDALRVSPFPLRLVVATPAFAQRIEGMLAHHPGMKATVVVLPGLAPPPSKAS